MTHKNTDKELLDWLDNNIFYRECVGLDGKLSEKSNMWVLFAPKGVQGSARAILTAAMEAQKGNYEIQN